VYLDHASSSPLAPGVFDAMVPYLREHIADPGRVHSDGRVTRVAIENAREQVAAFVGARPREVVFTSGGTEAVNAAIFGAVRRAEGANRIVTTAVEHSSVLDACRRERLETVEVGVDRTGRFDADAVLAAIGPGTAVVSVQLANHEVGTVQPVAEVCAGARERGVLVHVDACAAVGHAPVAFAEVGADLMSVTAHTWGGPKGTGALLVRRGLRIPQFVVGGAQERARRGGIENVPAIVGFGAAADWIAPQVDARRLGYRSFRRDLLRLTRIDGVHHEGSSEHHLPNLVCLTVDGVEAEPILLALDQRGIAVHSGSACSSESLEPSPVLAAMGADADHALRISCGWSTTDTDIDALVTALPEVIDMFRARRG
jgi:cysteine desulfurase